MGFFILLCFNPRARRGRDITAPLGCSHTPSFNPRARRGRDNAMTQRRFSRDVSIHAPAGGATAERTFH